MTNTKPIKKDIVTDGSNIRIFLHQHIYPMFLQSMFHHGFEGTGTLDQEKRTIQITFDEIGKRTVDSIMNKFFQTHLEAIMNEIKRHPEFGWNGEESMYFTDPLYRRMLYDTMCMSNMFIIKV